MDVRQLEALLAVAEAGSFTTAADNLHTVQSNVTVLQTQITAANTFITGAESSLGWAPVVRYSRTE